MSLYQVQKFLYNLNRDDRTQKEFGRNTSTSKAFTDYLNKNFETLREAAIKNIGKRLSKSKALKNESEE